MILRDKIDIFWKNSKKSFLGILIFIALTSLFSLCADKYNGIIAWGLTFFSLIFEVVFLGLALNMFVADLRNCKNEVKEEQKKLEQELNRVESEKKEVSESKANLDNLVRSVNEIVEKSGIEDIVRIYNQSGAKQAADAHSAMIKNNPGLEKQIETVQKISKHMDRAFPFLEKNNDGYEEDIDEKEE